MVRGLDYYTRTTFEFTHGELGAQSAVLGGGRYDGLSELLGGPRAPATGFAIGEDRLVLALQSQAESVVETPVAYIIPLGAGMNRHALKLARELRAQGPHHRYRRRKLPPQERLRDRREARREICDPGGRKRSCRRLLRGQESRAAASRWRLLATNSQPSCQVPEERRQARREYPCSFCAVTDAPAIQGNESRRWPLNRE